MLNINSPQGPAGEPGLAAVAGREQDFWTLFSKALDYVTAIGGTSIHVLSGIVPPHERPAAEKVIVANLARAADAAAAKNIFLMLEPLNQRDRPDYFVSHIEHIADIIAKVGKPNLKIMYDFYHVQVMQGDVLKRMEKHLPLIGHVQFAGPPTRAAAAEGRAQLSRSSSTRSTRWAGKAGSAPNTARAVRPWTAWSGASRTASAEPPRRGSKRSHDRTARSQVPTRLNSFARRQHLIRIEFNSAGVSPVHFPPFKPRGLGSRVERMPWRACASDEPGGSHSASRPRRR